MEQFPYETLKTIGKLAQKQGCLMLCEKDERERIANDINLYTAIFAAKVGSWVESVRLDNPK